MGSGREVDRGSVRCWRTEWEEQGEGQFRETTFWRGLRRAAPVTVDQ